MRDHRHRRRNRPLQVETLETLTLLTGPSALAMAPALVVAASKSAVALNSMTQGVYLELQAKPISGLQFTVNTTGTQVGLGAVAIYGKLNTPGFTATGKTTGTLVYYTGAGNLTLQVVGPIQAGYSGLPQTLSFTITGGTGKFHGHYGGSGTITVNLLTGYSGPKSTTHGQITIAFKAA